MKTEENTSTADDQPAMRINIATSIQGENGSGVRPTLVFARRAGTERTPAV